MSCVSFMTPRQREALQRAAAADDGAPLSTFASPPVTAGTVSRVRLLAKDERPGIRASAAAHKYAPAEVLDRLATDEAEQVRIAVARNPWAPASILTRLASDSSARVRGWIAANPQTDGAVLEALADDPDDEVRKVVAWARAWNQDQPPREPVGAGTEQRAASPG